MILGFPLARRLALMCVVLVLASNAYAANAMVESFMHANATSHSPMVPTSMVHDHDASAISDSHDDDHHAVDDNHSRNDRDANAADDDASRDRSAGHHHHPDLNVDGAYLGNQRAALRAQAFELVEIDLADAAETMLSWGIERPPRS